METSIFVMLLMVIIMLPTFFTKSHFRQMVGSAIANGADTEVKYNVLNVKRYSSDARRRFSGKANQ
ncbi:MAG: hypothetical protein ACI9LX_003559 [Paraglaciecola sp.]|jgi:hypothetical protein